MATSKSATDETKARREEQSPGGKEQNGAAPYVPRTELGRRLMEIRARIEASGQPLSSWEKFEREMAERRGVAWPDEV